METARVLRIAGSHNLRDMGGYLSRDGRHVKWGMLFRSGAMAGLPTDSHDVLHSLGIAAICDLRANHERERKPTTWHQDHGIDYYCRDYAEADGDLLAVIEERGLEAAGVTRIMEELYRAFPFSHAESYRALFARLIAGKLPLLFNCAAGKDRTGVAAALILSALDVPRETIEQDYALTDHAIDGLQAMLENDPRYAALAAHRQQDYMPLLKADPSYLAAAFDEIEHRHGTVAAYLNDVLGVGPGEVTAIRDLLLAD